MTAPVGIGHNRGPGMDDGVAWRRMLIGDAPGENSRREAARLGSCLPAERYFVASS